VTTWHAESPTDLSEIAGVVHDAWFDIDDVAHGESDRTLVVPFAQDGTWGSMREDPARRRAARPGVDPSAG
jgi:hypothetical protein